MPVYLRFARGCGASCPLDLARTHSCVFELGCHILTLPHEERGSLFKASAPYSFYTLENVENEFDRPFQRC